MEKSKKPILVTPCIFGVPQASRLSICHYDSLMEIVSPQRRVRTQQFLRRTDACRSLISEALIRYALKILANLEYSDLCMEKNQYGKPEIRDIDLHFNVAHSGEWVICGIDNHEIGVDIELIKPIELSIADRFFSPAEAVLIKHLTTNLDDRYRMFYNVWSLKESYIKAIGKGLSCPLNSFACLPSMDETMVILNRYEQSLPDRTFRLIKIDKHYSCAACLYQNNYHVNIMIVSPESLIDELM